MELGTSALIATIHSACTFADVEERAMKSASVALVIATTLLTSPVEARDRISAGPVVSPTIAGLMASAYGCGAGCGPGLYLAAAPAIYGYGYRPTYYGTGFIISRPIIQDERITRHRGCAAVASGSGTDKTNHL
jgi:hypothetical protein